MSKIIKQESSMIEDGFTFLGSMIGATVGATYDGVKDVAVGVVYDMPKAIVEGFEKGFEFQGEANNVKNMSEPEVLTAPEKAEPVVLSKEEYKAQLQAEMDRLDKSMEIVEADVVADPFNKKDA